MSQLYEIDSQGNKKIISGMVTGELPKYTMAEYTALTDKPIDWICTDYDATSEYGINATEVKYDSNNSVKDMLDIKTGTMSVKTGVDVTIIRSQLYKVGNLKCITFMIRPNVNISTDTVLCELSSGFESIALTDFVVIDTSGVARPFYINGSEVHNNGAITANSYYLANAVYR